MDDFLVAAIYKFTDLPDFEARREPLLRTCLEHKLIGTLLLASEGINGTIAGPADGVHGVIDYLRQSGPFSDLECKFSSASAPPFVRMKVRLKREIVTMGVPGIDPNLAVGTHVAPEAWNQLLEDPDLILIDARNAYEVAIGSFRGALNPKIDSFREFPAWLDKQLAARDKPKVAMFCTGGIRCEKSTALLRRSGFDEVYHLKGGILKYLELIPEEHSLWEGECFVFDERVSVGHGLCPGNYELCRACGNPINAADRCSPHFSFGVSCPYCVHRSTPERKLRFAERTRQVALAASRGKSHLKTAAPIRVGPQAK